MGYFSRRRPRVFGHRGAAGIAPENTLVSFERAVADGAEFLELDVHASRDDVVVVIHDPTLERTTDGHGPVRALSYAELRRHDAGYRFESGGSHPFRGRGVRVPSLEEVLDAFPTIPLNIEIKQGDPPIEPLVARLLAEKGASDRVLLAAEDDSIIKRIRLAAPDVVTSFSYEEAREFFQRCFAGDLGGYTPPGRALQVPPRFGDVELASRATIDAAHARGLEMHLWTINDELEMERLLELGADGLMSDFPAVLRHVTDRFRARS
ncbi:MAG: glycerophosphodiester phosphodiesterase [Candidatus Binatia bacterium]